MSEPVTIVSVIAELRHLHRNLVSMGKEEIANGLLAPQIVKLEKLAHPLVHVADRSRTMTAPTLNGLREARAAMGGLDDSALEVLCFEAMCRAYVECLLDDGHLMSAGPHRYPVPRTDRPR